MRVIDVDLAVAIVEWLLLVIKEFFFGLAFGAGVFVGLAIAVERSGILEMMK